MTRPEREHPQDPYDVVAIGSGVAGPAGER